MSYKVQLSACPNPDYFMDGRDPRGSMLIKAHLVTVRSFKDASYKCSKFIEDNELGGGNWDGGQIFDETGKQIAHVSYNGRVWEGKVNPPNVGKEIMI